MQWVGELRFAGSGATGGGHRQSDLLHCGQTVIPQFSVCAFEEFLALVGWQGERIGQQSGDLARGPAQIALDLTNRR